MKRTIILAVVPIFLLPALADGQVPAKLGYQGRLVNSTNGVAVTGPVTMTFKLFASDAGGDPLWTEVDPVTLTDGYYSLLLGNVTKLDPELFDGRPLYLELAVGADALAPRQQIPSVPYALKAGSVASVARNSTLTGNGSSASPLGVDTLQYGFFFEADACTNSSADTAAPVSDATASGGKACRSAYGATAGRMFGLHASDIGHLLAMQPSQVDFRLKVGSNTPTSVVLTQLNCAAIRAGSPNWIPVGKLLTLTPSDFANTGAWQAFSIGCDFKPDDVNQFVGIDGYVPGITDVSLDYVQVKPSRQPAAGLLVDSGRFDFTLSNGYASGSITFDFPFSQPPSLTCSEAGSAGSWVICKFDSVTKTGAAYAISGVPGMTAPTYGGRVSWIAVGR